MSKVESYYTPIGKINFPKTKINDKEWTYLVHPDGLTEDDVCSWKFSLILDPKEAGVAALLKLLDDQHSKIKGANFKPYKNDKTKNDDGTFTENGMIAIPFTTGYPIHLVDALKQKCTAQVGWGSKVRVKFTTKPVNNQGKVGLGRYVRALQIIELAESGQDISGFSEEKEGFQTSGKPESDEPWKE